MLRSFIAAASLSTLAASLYSCDCCRVGRPGSACADSGWSAGFIQQFTHFSTLREDGDRIPNEAHQRLDSSITQAIVAYDFNPTFALEAVLPYVYRDFDRANGHGDVLSGNEHGFGDAALIGSATVYRSDEAASNAVIRALAGVKFPTGDSGRLKEEEHEHEHAGAIESAVHGHDIALGSGSYDGIVGASAFASRQRLFVATDIQYAIRGEGDWHYRYANDLTWRVSPGIWLDGGDSFGVQLSLSGEYKGKDTHAGEKADDTAVNSVYLGPAATFAWQKRISADAGVDFPIMQDNSALQIMPDYRVRLGLIARF